MKQRAINLKDGPAVPPALVGVMVLLDRSGSMAAIKSQMVAAFGEFVHGQQQLDPEGLWLSLYQFDGQGFDVCYERMPIGLVGTLDLVPRGSTPLIDALLDHGLRIVHRRHRQPVNQHAVLGVRSVLDRSLQVLLKVVLDPEIKSL
mgnify:CR=1 FL=1